MVTSSWIKAITVALSPLFLSPAIIARRQGETANRSAQKTPRLF
jgi:hypothetical protein